MKSRMWLYIGKVNEGVSKDTVLKYIRDRCAQADANYVTVEQLPTLGRSPSFKVGIDLKYYEELKKS